MSKIKKKSLLDSKNTCEDILFPLEFKKQGLGA